MGPASKDRGWGPVQGFRGATLRRCGLLRTACRRALPRVPVRNLAGKHVGENVQEFMALVPDLPEDTAAWVLSELP